MSARSNEYFHHCRRAARAFENGISFDASAVRGFLNVEESDLFLFPDPGDAVGASLRPQQGRVVRFFCETCHPDGTHFEGDGRHILRGRWRRPPGWGMSVKSGRNASSTYLRRMTGESPPKFHTTRAGIWTLRPATRGKRAPGNLPDLGGDGLKARKLPSRARPWAKRDRLSVFRRPVCRR